MILQISPACMAAPYSSQTDKSMDPVLSATLTRRIVCPSFVVFGFPTSVGGLQRNMEIRYVPHSVQIVKG